MPLEPHTGAGSSPRLWGTLWQQLRAVIAAPVHPHACGEHDVEIAITGCLVRFIPTPVGNTSPRNRMPREVRFIPTPVGNTHSPALTAVALSVHPHACGEHMRNSCDNQVMVGSSPRLWGTHQLDIHM